MARNRTGLVIPATVTIHGIPMFNADPGGALEELMADSLATAAIASGLVIIDNLLDGSATGARLAFDNLSSRFFSGSRLADPVLLPLVDADLDGVADASPFFMEVVVRVEATVRVVRVVRTEAIDGGLLTAADPLVLVVTVGSGGTVGADFPGPGPAVDVEAKDLPDAIDDVRERA